MPLTIADLFEGFSKFLDKIFLLWDDPIFYSIIIGIVILLLTLFFFQIKRRCTRNIVIAQNTNGKIRVSQSAIKQVIYRSISETKGITKAKAFIKKRRSSLNICVKIYLLSGHKLNLIYDDLQRLIDQGLKNYLGLEKVGSIEILVEKVITNPENTAYPGQTSLLTKSQDSKSTEHTKE